MQFYQCKCGDVTSHTSMGVPPCTTCEKCGSTLGQGPTDHPEPKPHEFVVRYDQVTGAPYDLCLNCLRKRAELPGAEATVIVNGRPTHTKLAELTYEEIAVMGGENPALTLSMTWSRIGGHDGGTITRGGKVAVVTGLALSVAHTGNA